MSTAKILVVDDEEGTLKLLEKKLTAQKYKVLLAKNGQEAKIKILEEKPDLIIMDIMLPDIDGPEVIRSLQVNPYARQIPVFFLSSIIAQQDNVTMPEVKVGEKRYMAFGKPIDVKQLVPKIKEALSPSANS